MLRERRKRLRERLSEKKTTEDSSDRTESPCDKKQKKDVADATSELPLVPVQKEVEGKMDTVIDPTGEGDPPVQVREKIVEKVVEVQVPVEKIVYRDVEKIIEKPVVEYVEVPVAKVIPFDPQAWEP